MTDPPQADQTNDQLAFVPNGIITGGQKFGQRCRTIDLNRKDRATCRVVAEGEA